MMDNQGRVLSWEEVGRMLDHPSFVRVERNHPAAGGSGVNGKRLD